MDEDAALHLAALQRAGMPVDWTTVEVGWRGFEFGDYERLAVPSEEVSEFALDALADATGTEREQNVYRLADAGPDHEREEMDRALSRLASTEATTPTLALRRWRFALLYGNIGPILRGEAHARLATLRARPWTQEWYAATGLSGELADLTQALAAFPLPDHPPPSAALTNSLDDYARDLDGVREWLERERGELLAG